MASITFCDVLKQKTGLHFDLPTEAQWEYACRSGETVAFYNGKPSVYPQKEDTIIDDDLGEIAWYGGNWNWLGEESERSRAVGLKKPNNYGIFDMSGGLWEFCLDLYGEYDLRQEKDPVGPKTGSRRVVRGGSWHAWPAMCRSANRHFERGKFLAQGFRVVCMSPSGPCEYIVINLTNYSIEYVRDESLHLNDVHKTDKLVLRRIPKGTFMMGSPVDEVGRDEDETEHTVTLTKDYFMGVYVVTQKQWELIMGYNPSINKSEMRAVENIDYEEVRADV